MREILRALIEDASRHAGVLEAPARENDGAVREIGRHAGPRGSSARDGLLAAARAEIERLRVEAGGL